MEGKGQIFASDLFQHKRAIVTGGGTGIGYEIAELLGKLGAHVILVSRTEETLEKAVTSLEEKNIKANYFVANIRDETEVEKLFDKVSTSWGLPDFLINNAGGQFAASALDISPNGFRAVVDLNLQGTWHMSHAFASTLIKKQHPGKIINIVLSLKNGLPGMVHAGAARAGVVNMTKTLAYEWAEHDILINAIAPGTIQTTGLDQYDEAAIQNLIDHIPIKRMGLPEEVAEATAYLLSRAGDYITGTTLEIDGGDHLTGAKYQF